MRSYIVAFVVAMVASVLLTPLAKRLALALGAVGDTGGRNVHARRIPRLGGVALAAGWCLSVVSLLMVESFGKVTLVEEELKLAAVLLGGLTLCFVGAVDDVRGLRAVHKLAAQVLVAVVAYACGFRIDVVDLPLVGGLSMGVFALPVTVVWIVGITNAVNLIDGLDGLAAGVGFFASLTSFVIAVMSGNALVALLMAALMGVLAGFLFFNFNPARIFMGDSGSYFLGFVLATLSLTGGVHQKASTAVSLLVPMIALGLPIFDTLFSMFRRFLERRSLFSPDRGHIHHRLLDLGLTHRRAVVLLYGVCVVFTASAIAVSLGRVLHTGLALLSVSVVGIALVRFVGYFEYVHLLRRQKSRIYDERTERLRRAVPALIERLSRARKEQEVFELLEAATRELSLDGLELDQEGEVTRFESEDPVPSRDSVRATYPLGRDGQARARIRFLWRGDEIDVSPQVAILYQILVDAVTGAFQRTGSRFAPLVTDELPSRPAALPVPAVSGRA